jgi:hypothetical protein
MKAATAEDFNSLKVIPILKFGAKIRGQLVKTRNEQKNETDGYKTNTPHCLILLTDFLIQKKSWP